MNNVVRAALDRELSAIQDNLLRLGALFDSAVEQSMLALSRRDVDLARRVVVGDADINALRFRIEHECLALIATQQPAAGDLRAVIAALSIVSDIERMADHAAGIAKTVIRMGAEPLLKPLVDLPRMAEECRGMTRQALDAYLARDPDQARGVAPRDDAVDGLYQQVFRELLTYMIEDPHTTTRALSLLFVGHNLERIGDRACNIAERVVFMTEGELREFNTSPLVQLASLDAEEPIGGAIHVQRQQSAGEDPVQG